MSTHCTWEHNHNIDEQIGTKGFFTFLLLSIEKQKKIFVNRDEIIYRMFQNVLKYSTTYYNTPVGCDFQIFISKIKKLIEEKP